MLERHVGGIDGASESLHWRRMDVRPSLGWPARLVAIPMCWTRKREPGGAKWIGARCETCEALDAWVSERGPARTSWVSRCCESGFPGVIWTRCCLRNLELVEAIPGIPEILEG